MSDERLIVALDVPNALAGLNLAEKLGDTVSFYKIGLGMLTGGGLALANELKQDHGKRIFLDMKLFDHWRDRRKRRTRSGAVRSGFPDRSWRSPCCAGRQAGRCGQ